MQPVHLAGYFVFAPVELDGTHSWLVTEAILYDKICAHYNTGEAIDTVQ